MRIALITLLFVLSASAQNIFSGKEWDDYAEQTQGLLDDINHLKKRIKPENYGVKANLINNPIQNGGDYEKAPYLSFYDKKTSIADGFECLGQAIEVSNYLKSKDSYTNVQIIEGTDHYNMWGRHYWVSADYDGQTYNFDFTPPYNIFMNSPEMMQNLDHNKQKIVSANELMVYTNFADMQHFYDPQTGSNRKIPYSYQQYDNQIIITTVSLPAGSASKLAIIPDNKQDLALTATVTQYYFPLTSDASELGLNKTVRKTYMVSYFYTLQWLKSKNMSFVQLNSKSDNEAFNDWKTYLSAGIFLEVVRNNDYIQITEQGQNMSGPEFNAWRMLMQSLHQFYIWKN